MMLKSLEYAVLVVEKENPNMASLSSDWLTSALKHMVTKVALTPSGSVTLTSAGSTNNTTLELESTGMSHFSMMS